MKSFLPSTMLTFGLVCLSVAELGFVRNAEAIIGMARDTAVFRRCGSPFDV